MYNVSLGGLKLQMCTVLRDHQLTMYERFHIISLKI